MPRLKRDEIDGEKIVEKIDPPIKLVDVSRRFKEEMVRLYGNITQKEFAHKYAKRPEASLAPHYRGDTIFSGDMFAKLFDLQFDVSWIIFGKAVPINYREAPINVNPKKIYNIDKSNKSIHDLSQIAGADATQLAGKISDAQISEGLSGEQVLRLNEQLSKSYQSHIDKLNADVEAWRQLYFEEREKNKALNEELLKQKKNKRG